MGGLKKYVRLTHNMSCSITKTNHIMYPMSQIIPIFKKKDMADIPFILELASCKLLAIEIN